MSRSYYEQVTPSLRSAWNAPGAVPAPPHRVWRDWAVMALIIVLAVLEGLLRTDVPPLSAAVLIALAPTLLWRRTRPLLMVAIAFIVMAPVTLLLGDAVLFTSVFIVLLPYSLFRWGNGRAIVVGSAVLLMGPAMSAVRGITLADVLGEIAFLLVVVTLGVALRYRGRARMRELDRAKLLEREQLARDLHDTVAHHVSAIAIRAQAGLATATSNPDAAADALHVIETEASTTLAEMRSMIGVLRQGESPQFEPAHTLTDIEQLASGEQPGPRVDVRVTGDPESIPSTVSAAVYRLAQESITNARRHARNATRIDVLVEADAGGVRLRVANDGDVVPNGTRGYGITGMMERALLLGGTFQAGRAAGGGWVVDAVLPRVGWST